MLLCCLCFLECNLRGNVSCFQLQPIVIDASGHLLGRLASTIAKCLLSGKIFVVLSPKLKLMCLSTALNFYDGE